MRSITTRTAGRALAGGAALAVAVAAVAAGTAGGAGGTEPTMQFSLTMKGGSQQLVDSPPRSKRGPGMGDFVAFHKRLFDEQGRPAGRVEAHGMITTAGRNPAETLEGIMILEGGRLAIAESFRFSDRRHHIAITGGTGRFEGATGSILAGAAGQNRDDLLFRIWLP